MGRERDERAKEEERNPGGSYLPLGEIQVHSDLVSPQPGQVVMVSELRLELPQLLLGECGPLLAGLAAALQLPSVLLVVWGERFPNGKT